MKTGAFPTPTQPVEIHRPGRGVRGNSAAIDGANVGDRFSLERRLGRGSTGEVWQAVDIEAGERVALKLIHAPETDDPRFALRFRRLCRGLLPISHPHLVALRDYGYLDGRFYLATELVPGIDLARSLARRGRLPADEAARLAAEVCQGLEALHQRGLVHRGLKPRNLLIARHGPQVRLADSGLGAVLSESGLSNSHLLLDSLRYLSPEQARGEPVGPAADLYSLGVLLFEMLTGRLPFDTSDLWNLVRLHGWGEPPSPARYVRRIPPALSEIVVRAMQKTGGERYASAAEMGATLSEFLASPEHGIAFAASQSPGLPRAGAVPAIIQNLWQRSGPTPRRFVRPRWIVMGVALTAQFLASLVIGLAAFLPLSSRLLTSWPALTPATLFGPGGGEPATKLLASDEGRGDGAATPIPEVMNEGVGLAQTGTGSDASQEISPSTPPVLDNPDPDEDSAPESENGREEDDAPSPEPEGDHGDDEEEQEDHASSDEGEESQFWGIVESMDGSLWQIAGRSVEVTSRTDLDGRISVGTYVRVEALLGSNGVWRAAEIEREEEQDGDEEEDEDD